MLVALLSSQYARFATLADAWLKAGATSFGVFEDGQPLAYWPPGHRLLEPSLTVPIRYRNEPQGDLRVTGVSGRAAMSRLESDAGLVSYILQLENELQSMTADLVTSQDQQLALYRLTQMMRDHVTVAETLQALVTEAIRIIKTEAGFAVFVPTLAQSQYQEPLLVQYPEHTITDEMAWQLYWQTHATESDVQVPSHDVRLQLPAKIENIVVVPIRVRGIVMAGLGLINRPGGFETPDIKLIHAITDQASTQIERMLLYQETLDQAKLRTEMELARRVQADLLPREIPHVRGLDIYASSRSAYQVGGDFFDLIASEERPFIFSIGDVTGKGLSAALLMTMTRSAIHSKAYFMPDPSPDIIMRQSNEDLYNDFLRVGVFATAFVGQYEASSQQLLYANAGHAPVIYKPYDGEPTLLRADSTAIGILPVSYCRTHTLPMRSNDLLIVATDGFSDARNKNDEMFEIERLMELADRLSDRPARTIAEKLFQAVDQFSSGRSQDDDQTLVVIKGVSQ